MSKTAILAIFILIVSAVLARPTKSQSLSRSKRQSDQRLAELETLLALQKYGRNRFRADHKKGVGANREHEAGYGIIDFRMLGRKKKSTRFSPGELAISSGKGASGEQHQRAPSDQHNLWTSEETLYPEQLSDQEDLARQEAAVPVFYTEK